MVFPFRFLDRKIVVAGKSPLHQPVVNKFPVLITIGAKPVAGVIVPFIDETNRNAIFRERSQLFDQPILELLRPFARRERDDLGAAMNEFRAVCLLRDFLPPECPNLKACGLPTVPL